MKISIITLLGSLLLAANVQAAEWGSADWAAAAKAAPYGTTPTVYTPTKDDIGGRRIYFVNETSNTGYCDIYYVQAGSNIIQRTSPEVKKNSHYVYSWDGANSKVVSAPWIDRCGLEAGVTRSQIYSGEIQALDTGTLYSHVHRRSSDYYCDFIGS